MSALDDHRGLSPVMQAYWTLVKAHRDWNQRDDSNSETTRKILNRMAHAKKRLMDACGGHNQHYVRMWSSAKAEGEALAKEANHA